MDKEIAKVSKMSDDILAVVMNAEVEFPESAISALAHVASLIALELKMPRELFSYCMNRSYEAVKQAEEGKEVH